MGSLQGKVALVTGGARGIGLAVARALAGAGAQVAIADIDPDGAARAAGELDASGVRSAGFAVDVADPASVAAMVRAVQARFGRLDILVNNAGIGGTAPFLDLSVEDWNRTIGVNLTGAFLVAQACARVMVAQEGGGRIVNVTSTSGQRGGYLRAAYGAAKAGLELLTKVMAVELAARGVGVNAVAPGPVETEMSRGAHDPAVRAAYLRRIPAGRYGRPEDIAQAVLFLCSEASAYLHGHVLTVDGGFVAAGLMADADPAS